jgi:uncharacterized SAM-binding protein YcdF (DUF218 family)
MFIIKRILESLFLPPLAPLLLIVAGLCLLRKWPRLAQGLAWSGVLLSLFLMLPYTVETVMAPLENSAAPLNLQQAQGAEAIVILGGGGRRHSREYKQPSINRLTLERLRYGARLARQSGLPILLSGGVAGAQYTEARMMAESLRTDFGLNPLWLEERSANTEENAHYSAAILKEAGVQHIILVTHAAHMRRAYADFSATGLKVTPAPTAFFTPLTENGNSLSWLPTANSSYAAWYALHEWAGLLQRQAGK